MFCVYKGTIVIVCVQNQQAAGDLITIIICLTQKFAGTFIAGLLVNVTLLNKYFIRECVTFPTTFNFWATFWQQSDSKDTHFLKITNRNLDLRYFRRSECTFVCVSEHFWLKKRFSSSVTDDFEKTFYKSLECWFN